MITQTIRSAQFDALATTVATAGTNALALHAIKELAAFIDGFVVAQRHKAVEQYKAEQKLRGLVLCNEMALDEVLTSSAIPRSVQPVFEAIKTDLLNTHVTSVEPEFTIEDPDLNAFANDTAALLSGHANQDIGMAWLQSLETLKARLSAPATPQPIVDIDTHLAYVHHQWLREKLSLYAEKHLRHAAHDPKWGGRHPGWTNPVIKAFADEDTEYLRYQFQDEFWSLAFSEYLASILSSEQMARITSRSSRFHYQWMVAKSLLKQCGITPPASAITS